MFAAIRKELGQHLPFTFIGGITGIIIMFFSRTMEREAAHTIFYILHPTHVFLSALVTASLYARYKQKQEKKKPSLPLLLVIGYCGAIGIATLSDSLIPYVGEIMLKMPGAHHHIGFIEKWWLINPVAILGIIAAYRFHNTQFPHAGHVFISTWASLFHIIMAKGEGLDLLSYVIIFIFLVLSVWLPCCVSDIIFPLLFVRQRPRQ